jgi:hypothetical protein
MLNGGLGGAIPQELRIEMGMRVDESRRDDLAFGIVFFFGRFADFAYGDNFAVFNAYICGI